MNFHDKQSSVEQLNINMELFSQNQAINSELKDFLKQGANMCCIKIECENPEDLSTAIESYAK